MEQKIANNYIREFQLYLSCSRMLRRDVGNYDKGDVFLTCATLKSIDMEYLMTSKCGKLRLHFLITLNITGSAPSLTTC